MSYLSSSPTLTNIKDILGKYPRRGILLFKLLDDIKNSCSPLNRNMRELIISFTSGLNQCDLNNHTHKAASEQRGIEAKVLYQLKNDIKSAQIDEELKPVLRYVKKLTLTPNQITQSDAQQIFDAGWDENVFLEVIFLCAIVNSMNRIVSGIGLDK
jgi:uncharacterized peroxidase-related enzyme